MSDNRQTVIRWPRAWDAYRDDFYALCASRNVHAWWPRPWRCVLTGPLAQREALVAELARLMAEAAMRAIAAADADEARQLLAATGGQVGEA